MVNSPAFKQFFIAFLVIVVLIIMYNESTSLKVSSVDLSELPDDTLTFEGYVVAKRINSIWISEEPVSFTGRIFGLFSGYGPGSVIVSKHDEAPEEDLFNRLKTNQKVRVYGDILRESNPPRTSAYAVEVID
ncbi:DUF3221 domain-containing protein [Alkalicoccobacillus porphyridii]|uniref:DUF3221 domain-containing protein n=1 Tax=Alkalicoccobacillus porphyridii TaxID=2597270 RepID=A0A554A224_9BACI|nr:DUF3221 domain-containing protein [Alkalicoccobacillus porphyridii]TSB47744.1 DUF3221 domain-containing protein [Alkalicoccobacillus porphyridii]